MEALKDFSRLSLNQITTGNWNLREAVDGCVRNGIPWIAVWRHKLAEYGAGESARMIRDAGLRVSSLCRGGMFPAATAAERATRIDDNRRAIDEAAELGTEVLVLVNGPAPDRDLAAARQMVADGIAAVAPYARERGVKLGIEPLHPMFAGDRSVIVTIGEANRLAAQFDARDVGLVLDVFHIWWDPELDAEVARSKGRILGFHVNDWIVPMPDLLMGRGMMGDGKIDLRRIRGLVEAAGYEGPIEVEIFNQKLWDMPGDEALELVKGRYLEYV